MWWYWIGVHATIIFSPGSLQPLLGTCSNHCCAAVSLNTEHLAILTTQCDATLWVGALMPSCTTVRGCGCFVQKGATFFYGAANESHLPSDARCSQLLCLGHPSVGNWAACLKHRPTPRRSALPLMDVYRVLIDINTCGTDGATDANQMSYFWLSFHEPTGESFNAVVGPF